MTTIRRITVSQIDGNGADDTNTSEIRPAHETAFYLDNNNKLTLMMFNGERTHRKSKVLAPGVLWGSNADSGDGNAYDTIKLIPDSDLFAGGSDQYIIVDPTGPNHVHLRAGGTIDDSNSELIIGGETSHVKIGSGPNPTVYIKSNDNQWTFGNDGSVTLPGGGNINGADYDIEIVASNDGASTFGSVSINTQAPPLTYTVTQEGGFVSGPGANNITGNTANSPGVLSIVVGMTVTGPNLVGITTVTDVSIGPGGDFTITTDADEINPFDYNAVYTFTSASEVTNRNWEFNSLGEFYLPQGGAIQETEITNEAFGTTTTSLTLVPAGASNGTQRLEIYGTIGGEGNHIHITSGDQNQTDLFLGNDTQYFAVGAMGENTIQARPGVPSSGPGTPAGAGSTVFIYAGDAGYNGGNSADGAMGGDVWLQAGTASNGLGGQIILQSASGPTGFGSIKLSTDGGSTYWDFAANGNLILPAGGDILDSTGNSVLGGSSSAETLDITDTNGLTTTYYPTFVENRTTGQYARADVNLTYRTDTNTLGVGALSFSGGTFRVVSVPASSAGASGDKTGDVAFNSNYIYYCTENFGGTTYNVVHMLAQGLDANGVDNGYLVDDEYQLPQVGWKVYYNGEIRTIDQVNNSNPGFYIVFVSSPLTIPGQAAFAWGPTPATDIWKRLAWSGDTW